MNFWQRAIRPVAAVCGLLSAVALVALPAHGQNTVRPTPQRAAVSSSVQSPHGASLREACATCHRPDGWRPARIAPTFAHAEKTFPLTGAHVRTTCMSCHKGLDFRGAVSSCASCHTDTHNGELGATCQRCHNTRSFVDRGAAVRSHEGSRFPLRGAHALATCESCHQRTAPGQQRFLARNATCSSCHMPAFQATRSPNHAAANFSSDCTTCHTISTWSGATFDHSVTKFPLTGRHALATCASCHADKVYSGKPTACNSCHAPDAAKAVTPKHEGFATTCESCHTTTGWAGAPFDHDKLTPYPLTGGHRTATCAQCHADKVYRGRPTACVSCHQSEVGKSTNPDHAAAKFTGTCETCHSTAAWKGARYDHNLTKFPLTGRHVSATCLACHTDKVYAGKPSACASCHQREADGAKAPSHAGFPAACETCHSTAAWKGARFDHDNTTRFPLTGAHRTTTCAGCHGDGVYRGKPTTCTSCHQTQYDATTTPHHKEARFGTACESCHTTTKWPGATFDHNAQTRFPLLGRHVPAACLACHSDRVYAGKPSVCQSCHQKDYDLAAAPNHKAGGFPITCETCHTASGWKPSSFNHDVTRFALQGAHRTATCTACHADGVYRGKPTECASCHQARYDGTTNPNHRALNFPVTCGVCHSVNAWKPVTFDHNITRFPLTGAHRPVACESCHKNGQYTGTSSTCVSCHQAKFDGTTAPNHRTAGLATTCLQCHTTTAWQPATYDHSVTRFPLVGAHRSATCASCHGDGVYRGKAMACATCHLPKFNATTKPAHAANGIGNTCESCHTATAWTPATYDHAVTRFPLTGGHRTASCAQCHSTGVYRGTSLVCSTCHQPAFDATTNPNHRTAGFPTTCQQCHNSTAWKPATFDHNATRFPLTGSHRTVVCLSCHKNGQYAGTPSTCIGCHQSKFDATTSPNHKAGGIPTTCLQCHTTTAWQPATFDHNASAFPLTGLHRTVSCASCHGDGVYKGKTTLCSGCHLTKFNATTKPAHATNGIGTSCQSCHTTNGWTPGTYDHAITRFPLTGGHRTVSCAQCHASGVYRGTSMVCSTCHLPAYNATTNPNHRTSGFPTTCQQCHNSTAWKPASFDHNATAFPLTGSHRTVVCLSCHKNGQYSGTPSTCIGCHQTKFDATTTPNHRTSGIPTACIQCHTTTAWQPATFDHNASAFPLTGLHRTVSCASCHGDGVYKGKTTLCSGCHLTKFNATTRPAHAANGIGTTCQSCHTTNGWTPGTYDHAITRFPLTGGHRTVSCAQCHASGVYRGTSMVCSTCHLPAYNATTNPNHRTSGFPTACQQCHNSTAWKPASFDHNATAFPLTGSHRTVVCLSCHKNNVYSGTPSTCIGCHQTKFDATTAPNHRTSGIPTTCLQCHTTTAWQPATFDHNATAFPLTGLHRTVTCSSCHSDGVYKGKTTLCSGCHLTKFNATTRPAHAANGIGTTCQTCHTVNGWTPATYDHAVTRFPLAGAHRAVSCAGCHANGVYRGKSMACASCHLPKFNATTRPPHASNGIGTTCETCHNVTAWTPATYDHNATTFPLTGGHRTVGCAQCHGTGVYRGTSKVCSSCHLTRYNATTNPNHRTAMFPTTCESCHTTTVWTGATFAHDGWFPVYSGKHRGKWNSCTECHTNSANYKEFTCLTCHTKTKTDDQHRGRSGYSYTSPACYSCHPRGNS